MGKVVNSKKEIVEILRNQWERNPDNAVKAMLVLYQYQTLDEKKDGRTSHNNGVGFNGCDDAFLSSLCRQIINQGRSLSAKQKACVVKMMHKYALQIANHAINTGKIRKENGKYCW